MAYASSIRRIRREYPYSRFAALAELRVADCKFKQSQWAEAITAYRQFVRFRPSHDQISYARFRVAQAHFEQIPSEWFLSPPTHERDQGPTNDALRQLRRFILDFPEDDRVEEAQDMVRRCLKLLAEHELYAARFYLRRDAYPAVILRLQTLLSSYQGSGVEPEGRRPPRKSAGKSTRSIRQPRTSDAAASRSCASAALCPGLGPCRSRLSR